MSQEPNRIEALRRVVDGILRGQSDEVWRRAGWVHLYGVAQVAAMLAKQRGVDVELAMAAGMLHDIATFSSGDSIYHAARGAPMAQDILRAMDCHSEDEIAAICQAVANHSDKQRVDAPLDEVIKDADVLQFYLYNPTMAPLEGRPWRDRRLRRLLSEAGILAE